MKKDGSLLTGLITVVAVLAVLSLGISAIMRGCGSRTSDPSPTPTTPYLDPLLRGYENPRATQARDGYFLTATDSADNAVLFFADTPQELASAEPKTLEGVTGPAALYNLDGGWTMLGADGALYACAGDDPRADRWTRSAAGEADVTACAIADGDTRLLVRCGAGGITLTALNGFEKAGAAVTVAQPAAQPVTSVSPILNDGRLYLIYTAGEGADRAAYMLSLSDPEKWDDADSWVRFSAPVFHSGDGPGSLSFVTDAESSLFIYDQAGTDGQPVIRLARYYFSETGLPVFGLPAQLK